MVYLLKLLYANSCGGRITRNLFILSIFVVLVFVLHLFVTEAHCAFADQGSCAIAKCPSLVVVVVVVVVVVKAGISCRGARNANVLNAAKGVDSAVSVHECSHFSREVL